jgi:hypothetical protein
MKPQQLISAGFAITALAAASIPALGWSLLGDVIERPAVSVQASGEAPALFTAETVAPLTVSYRFLEPSERDSGEDRSAMN